MIKRYLFQEADFYGASQLIFDRSRLPVCYKATWMHGLGHVFKDNYNKNILIHYNELWLPIHLVNNSETADFLASEGVDSIPVGVPYIYTKDFSGNKESRSFSC